MSREPRTVRAVDRLDSAARVMWEQDCGFVPVVDGSNTLVGVVTDRDLCMASYTQGRALAELPVAAAMARTLRTCRPDDTLATVMASMQEAQVHRLPVVDARGVVVGVVAMNDLVRLAAGRPAVLDAATVMKAKAVISAPRRPAKADAATAPKSVVLKAGPAVHAAANPAPSQGSTAAAMPAAKPPAAKAPAAQPGKAAKAKSKSRKG